MKHAFASLLIALLSAPALPQAPDAADEVLEPLTPPMMLRMSDGRILWGAIVAHDEASLSYRRLDNGGIVRLRWPLLDPTEESELRLKFGYVETGVEEIMISADKLTLVDGTELVGLILDRSGDNVRIKRAEGQLSIPKARISGSTIVQVPALDLYTKEELYNLEVAELLDRLNGEGTAAAEAHFEIAQYAEQLYDFIHAAEHYGKAIELDPEFETERIQPMYERAQQKAALQGQVDHLAQIDLWRARKYYDKAIALLNDFPVLYPESPLMEDWGKLRDRVQKYQLRDLRAGAVRSWHRRTFELAQQAARKKSYEEVMSYLEGGMGEEVLLAVQQDLQKIAPEIQTDEVRRLWDERKSGKWRSASYGHGTWLLGEDNARSGLEEQNADPTEKGTLDDARKKIEEKLKRYLKNQQIARKGNATVSEEEDPGRFWAGWPSANKAWWVLAYHVENSGDFQIEKFRFRNCRTCGGSGLREVIITGGAIAGATSGRRMVPCPTCHTIGVVRLVRYR
ncbi:MAG: hypothetical protein O7B99_12275 [Planctomycetota bacterium]|nr:hypothetical protein [Planctomycetota bacterium]